MTDRALTYVMVAIIGSLLSGWGWWVSTSIMRASEERTNLMSDWSGWRGTVTQKLDSMREDQLLIKQELEEIKRYLRSRGWKSNGGDQSRRPAKVEPEKAPETG